MSFGFSPSDIFALVNIARKTYRGWKSACGEYADITTSLDSLLILLERIEDEAEKPRSAIVRNRRDADDLGDIINACNKTVRELHAILTKFQSLGQGKSREKNWDRIRFGNKNLDSLRSKLQQHGASLAVYLDTVGLSSLARIENQNNALSDQIREAVESLTAEIRSGDALTRLEQALELLPSKMQQTVDTLVKDIHSGRREGSIMTTYTDDEKDVWKQFRRELIGEGFRSSEIHKLKPRIELYLRVLAEKGLLEEAELPEAESCRFESPDPLDTFCAPEGNSLAQSRRDLSTGPVRHVREKADDLDSGPGASAVLSETAECLNDDPGEQLESFESEAFGNYIAGADSTEEADEKKTIDPTIRGYTRAAEGDSEAALTDTFSDLEPYARAAHNITPMAAEAAPLGHGYERSLNENESAASLNKLHDLSDLRLSKLSGTCEPLKSTSAAFEASADAQDHVAPGSLSSVQLVSRLTSRSPRLPGNYNAPTCVTDSEGDESYRPKRAQTPECSETAVSAGVEKEQQAGPVPQPRAAQTRVSTRHVRRSVLEFLGYKFSHCDTEEDSFFVIQAALSRDECNELFRLSNPHLESRTSHQEQETTVYVQRVMEDLSAISFEHLRPLVLPRDARAPAGGDSDEREEKWALLDSESEHISVENGRGEELDDRANMSELGTSEDERSISEISSTGATRGPDPPAYRASWRNEATIVSDYKDWQGKLRYFHAPTPNPLQGIHHWLEGGQFWEAQVREARIFEKMRVNAQNGRV